MKNPNNKLSSLKAKAKNSIGKYVALTSLAVGSVILPGMAKAQEVTNERQLPIMDFYFQPNTGVIEGRNVYDYYGSGDVNNDEVRDNQDLALIQQGNLQGLELARADVSGDGVVSADTIDAENDYKILNDFITGQRAYLPGDWNKLSPSEKDAWADKRIPKYIYLTNVGIDCEINSDVFFLNFNGLVNFENYLGIDRDGNGTLEGYDYYKDKIKFGNGFELIPLREIAIQLKSGGFHTIIGYWRGKEGEESNPLNVSQYRFIDWRNGEEVEIGPYINENGFIHISGIYWNPLTQNFVNEDLVSFDLENGIATLDTLGSSSYVLFQNPAEGIVDLAEKDGVYIEADGRDISELKNLIEEPELETNLHEHKIGPWFAFGITDYTPEVTYEDSEFVPADPNYPAYGEFTRKVIAETKEMGRWTSSDFPNLKDSLEFLVTIADRTSPEMQVQQYSINAEENENLENLVKQYFTGTDASTSYGYQLEKVVTGLDTPVSEDENFKYYDAKVHIEDVSENTSLEETIRINQEKLPTALPENPTDPETERITIKAYPNPLPNGAILRINLGDDPGDGTIYVYDLAGKILDIIPVDDPSPYQEIEYSGFDKLKNGTYVLNYVNSAGYRSSVTIVK